MESPNQGKKKTAVNGGMPKVTREQVEKLLLRKDLKDFKFPLGFDKIVWENIEFLAWKHPSGHKGYVLEAENGEPRIWVLECNTKPTNTKLSMCRLCNSIRSGSGSRMFSYRPEKNRNKTVSFHLCSDLGCVDNVTKLNPNSMRETISPEEKRERMVENLHEVVSIFDEANS